MPEIADFNALQFALVGVTIVFAALTLITIAVILIRRADEGWQQREQKARDEAADKDQNIDTTTLILVAAAAATMIQGRFHIRRVRRLMPSGGSPSSWSVQGRAILQGSHIVSKKPRQD